MGENSGHQNEKVMCDFCLEKPLPMVKSHLSCKMSLCPPGQAQHKGFPERPHPGGALWCWCFCREEMPLAWQAAGVLPCDRLGLHLRTVLCHQLPPDTQDLQCGRGFWPSAGKRLPGQLPGEGVFKPCCLWHGEMPAAQGWNLLSFRCAGSGWGEAPFLGYLAFSPRSGFASDWLWACLLGCKTSEYKPFLPIPRSQTGGNECLWLCF